jgi:hypothetical protein
MLFLAVEQKYLHGWKAGDVEILYLYTIDLNNLAMIDKTMCVNLRVEVGKHPQVILAMYFYLGQE